MLICRLCEHLTADYTFECCDENIIPSLCSFYEINETDNICICDKFKMIKDINKYIDFSKKK